jgi:hypothetical protein
MTKLRSANCLTSSYVLSRKDRGDKGLYPQHSLALVEFHHYESVGLP